MATSHRGALAAIFVTITLDMLTIGMIGPVLPKLVLQFTGSTANAAVAIGLFMTVWAVVNFGFSPVLGILSDRFGRRPVILISNFGSAFDYVVMALAPSLGWLFVGRTISGITSASIATCMAYISDVTPEDKRAGAFGLIGAAFGLGFSLGPACGGVLGQVDPRLPFWVAGGLSFANGLYAMFVLRESLPRDRRATTIAWTRANPIGALRMLRSHPELWRLSVVTFFGYVAHEAAPTIFVLYAFYRFGWNERSVGFSLALIGITSMVVSAGLVGKTVARFGDRTTMLAGLAITAASLVVYGATASGVVFLVAVAVSSLGGLTGPALQSLMTKRVGPEAQGELQGALASMRGIAMLLGPGLFTLTFAAAVAAHGAAHLPGAPWFLSAALYAVSLVIAARPERRAPATT